MNEIERLQRELDERTATANVKMYDQRTEIEQLRTDNEKLKTEVWHLQAVNGALREWISNTVATLQRALEQAGKE